MTAGPSSNSMTRPKQKPGKPGAEFSVKAVLEADLDGKADSKDIRTLFAFDGTMTDEEVVQRFRVWSRHFFFNYFHVADAPFHAEMDARYVAIYCGSKSVFINAAYRGAAKTTRQSCSLPSA
jgi:hypothetical protein